MNEILDIYLKIIFWGLIIEHINTSRDPNTMPDSMVWKIY